MKTISQTGSNKDGGRGRETGGRNSIAGSPASLLRPLAPRSRRGGFTLVEVLISIAILAVGAVLIMQALVRGAYALTVASNRSTVYSFAAAKLTDLELSTRQGVAQKSSGRFGSGAGQFEWQVDASPLDDEPQLSLVTLTVAWRQGRHRYESHFSTVQRLPPEAPL